MFRLLNLPQVVRVIEWNDKDEKVLQHSIFIGGVMLQICVM